MQITGQITNIVADGGYDGQGGHINTFQMTINTSQGPITGRIGSKSSPYPMSPGAEITVEQSDRGYGPEFKKINPQYANQQQPPQQQGYQPPQQQAPPPQQDTVQDRIAFAQALNLAVSEYVNGKIEELLIKERARIYYHVLKSRAFPLSMSNDAPPPQQEPPQPAPPPYDPNAAFNPTDDIPF